MSTAAAVIQPKVVSGTLSIIRRFTFRRAIKGFAIFGVFAAVENIAQSAGIVAAYPNIAERAKVINSLSSNAALGIFYGDRHANIVTASGYMVYRALPIVALIGSIWGLMFITRMLRGQEESGRWELLLTGQASAEQATAKTIAGAMSGVALSYFIAVTVLALGGRDPKVSLSLSGCLFYGLAICLPLALAVSWGAVTSQLAATRRRAVMYGVIPIAAMFALRSIGNIIDSLVWLKNLTPFGWVDKLHPFYHSQPVWLVPLAALTVALCVIAILLAGKRDMAESIIADADSSRPKFGLLSSQVGFTFRSTRNILLGWLAASLVFGSVVAAVDKTVAKSITDTGTLTKTFSNISGNPTATFELAYLSAAGYLTVTILMLMMAASLGSLREEEASGRLDNFLSGTVSRRRWLLSRLVVLISGAVFITLLTNLVVWAIAEAQSIHVNLGTMLVGGLNILGPVIFLLGVGVLMYGILPRVATAVMYVLIAWSFTLDIVASALKMNHYVADTSLLHHISLVPAASANWKTFSVLMALGVIMLIAGLSTFQRRDLQAE